MISFIITTKNNEKTLERLLQSIKKQTYKDWEIIVVDNNSTDKTKEIAKKFTEKVFNKGPERSMQRNFGVQKARGKYVVILDSDMYLGINVAKDCLKTINNSEYKALVIPEKTVGNNWLARVRRFEREMYEGDLKIEVARFFKREVFLEFGGYDINLTGPEDYDLHYRISKKYPIGRANEYLYHDESDFTLIKLLQKKFYYAKAGARYANKHPELVKIQGNLLFRKAYFKNWKKFVRFPFLGISFIFVRILETIIATAGFISAVGIGGFIKTILR